MKRASEEWPRKPIVAFFTESARPSRYRSGAIAALESRGLRIEIVTTRSGSPFPGAEGQRAFPLGSGTSANYPLAAWRLARYLRSHDVDLLHAHEPIQGAIGGVAARLARIPMVWHRHHTATGRAQQRMSRVAGRTARVTIAVSQAAADSARRDDRIPEDRLRVALNGIPDLRPVSSAEVLSLKGALGIGSDDLVVVILARSRPEKGHTVLVHALSAAAAHAAKPLHLVSVGSGPHDPVIRDACSKASTFRSHLVGHQEDVALWLNLAHVVVAPSLVEPFGLSTIEAMAAAKPVVASGVEGLDEVVVEGRTGLKVPPGDPIALAGALSSLLSDRDARDRMGLAGRTRYLDLFTIDKMVARWLDVYREVIPSLETPTVL